MTQQKEELFDTSLGKKTKPEIQKQAISISVKDKISKWAKELVSVFPEYSNQISKLLNLLHFSQDYFVQQSLLYAPKEVSFCLMKDCVDENIGMNYDLQTMKIEVNPLFIEKQLSEENNLFASGTFLKKIVHELTHAAQACKGVYPTYIQKMSCHNALLCELMTEVDAFVVETRFMYELMKSACNQSEKSELLVNTEVGVYCSYIERMADMNLSDDNKQLYADVMVAAILMDFPRNPKEYNGWQQVYLSQTYKHLLARPVQSLTMNETKISVQEKYMCDYYANHFPIIDRVKQQLIQNLDIRPLEQAVVIGERLPCNERITYRDIHKAQINLGVKKKHSTAQQILSTIRRNRSR